MKTPLMLLAWLLCAAPTTAQEVGDTFADTDGTALTAHTASGTGGGGSWTAVAGTATIYGNKLLWTSGDPATFRLSSPLADADMSVCVTVGSDIHSANTYYDLLGRYDAASDNAYVLRFRSTPDAGNNWIFYKRSAGVNTVIGSVTTSSPMVASSVVCLEVTGTSTTTLVATRDGAWVNSTTDSSSPWTGTRVGVGFFSLQAATSVASITRSGSTATVTHAGAHGHPTGSYVTIAGADQAEYNGTFQITSTGTTTYTFAVSGTPATPATGTLTARRPPSLETLSATSGLAFTAKCAGAHPSWTANGVSWAHIQSCINMMSGTAEINVPSGSAVLTERIAIISTKTVTLRGAGAGATTLTMSASTPSSNTALTGLRIDNNSSRITGFTFSCMVLDINDARDWRVDHNAFTCATWQNGVLANNVSSKVRRPRGLVDHNTFSNMRVLVFGWAAASLGDLNGSNHWTNDLGLGTVDAVYVEDNTFTFTVFGNVIDANYSGEFVFRYNTVTDSYIECHSVQSVHRATRKWEIYNNTITQSAVSVERPFFLRGGTGVVFNNTLTGTYGNAGRISFDVHRTANSVTTFGQCNGSGASLTWDGNADASGYPCRDQIGRAIDESAFSTAGYVTQTLTPAYVWDNTINGAAAGVLVLNGSQTSHIIENRDYYVNSGAMPGYTSYTYPHPLNIDDSVAAGGPLRLRRRTGGAQ